MYARSLAVGYLVDDDVHAAVSGNTNLWARSALSTIDLDARLRADLAVESTEIDADDGHDGGGREQKVVKG